MLKEAKVVAKHLAKASQCSGTKIDTEEQKYLKAPNLKKL